MSRTRTFCSLALILTTALAAGSRAAAAEPAELAAVADGDNQFAVDLYAKLAAEKKGENLFFSPLSVSTALGMTCAGARGETAAEMKQTLHFALADDKLHPALGALVGGLNAAGKAGGFELSVANALWGQKGGAFLPGFLALNKSCYGAGLETLDFAADAEAARKTINAWVEKQTQDKIKDLLAPGTVGAATRLVLTNAVYFKGEWEQAFKETSTRDIDFNVGDGRTVRAPMMDQTGRFPLAEGKGFQALELPYKGKHLAMTILLPEKADGLSELEKKLSAKLLDGLKPAEQKVRVSIPRFEMTWSGDLVAPLRSLGMDSAFEAKKADFSGINGAKAPADDALFISAVVHKAFVEVNEKGTEAAAATAVVMYPANGHSHGPPSFIADHPFIFLIRDRETGSILFLGRVENPTGKPPTEPAPAPAPAPAR